MSYLVDALKKAERERYARSAGDLHQAAAMDAQSRRGTGVGRWLLAALVATNVALVVYIWRPQADNTPHSTAAAAAQNSTSARSVADARTAPRKIDTPGPTRDGSSAPTTPAMPATPIVRATVAAPAPARATAGGKVTYSTVPLTGEAGTAAAVDKAPETPDTSAVEAAAATPASAASLDDDLPTQAGTSAPAITINGQLYSTVPGRSFILVDGRRYHEGERLAAGPAVEQIEPSGAVLRFQGQRYRVAGPG